MEEETVTRQEKMKKAIAEFLVSFPFFDSLTSEELALVGEHIDLVEIDAGQILFNEGDKGDGVYFVVAGELDVIKESVSGPRLGIDKVVITSLSRGRSIGEMSVIDKTPRSATVRARTKATLISLSLEGFDMICEDFPRVGIKILKGISRLLSTNMRKTSSRLADYMLPMG